MIKLVFDDGKIIEEEKYITVYDVIKKYSPEGTIGVMLNGIPVPCDYKIPTNVHIQFLSLYDRPGEKIYLSSLKFVMLLAVERLFGNYSLLSFKHSLDKGIYCELDLKVVTPIEVARIKREMKKIVKESLDIHRVEMSINDIVLEEQKHNEYEKILNRKFFLTEISSEYELDGIYNNFYYILAPNTSYIKYFDLTFVMNKGIILSYPISGKVPKYVESDLVLNAFVNYENCLNLYGIKYACDVNKMIVDNKIRDYIQIMETIYEDGLYSIVNKVSKDKKIKAIYISGPSSSGKTTSSKKLALALKTKGIDSFVISTDDYYVDRVDNPVDENGEYDYEIIDAIDYKLFDNDMKHLLAGEEVIMPKFNFKTGEKEFKSKPVSLKKGQILIIEGLHAVNEKLSSSIDKKNKLKIYVSPFTPLGLDRHNHISTTDIRLLRRLVRDFKTRGYNAEDTLSRWKKMRKSEEINVYPYQRECNFILNTSFGYEIGIIKTHALPLLYSIEPESEYYAEAVRIINILNRFLNIPSEYVPNTCVLREFIGNSYFE